MITKLACSYCGRRFSVAGSPQTINTARRAFNQEHAGCRLQAYHAALKLVKQLEPRPDQNRDNRICGRLCRTLDEAVRALLEIA